MAVFIAWIFFIHFEQKTNVNHMKKHAKIFFCDIGTPNEKIRISEFVQYLKFIKMPFLFTQVLILCLKIRLKPH